MAERGTAVGAWDREHEQALVADVRHDDPGLARVPIPLERDRVISVLARVSSSMNTAGSLSVQGRLGKRDVRVVVVVGRERDP
jgi:hypothetical protein